ncbi:phage tail protein [Yersinia kristensenii]|uniref:phage tail protein n=1 Tax=Yersinia kristensenii TaxID=28152 RepID=UPI001FE72472|nr:phage tail protein [Yersinia kristensenii]MDA5524999.1 phage tail protein [Yersinia kristensenii]
MKYYKDKKNEVYAYEDDCADEFIKKGLSSITEEEALMIVTPAPTADELAAVARGYRDAFILATDTMTLSDYSIDDTLLTNAQRAELTATRALYRAWPTLESWPLIELPELPQWLLVEAVNQGYRVPVWPPLPA